MFLVMKAANSLKLFKTSYASKLGGYLAFVTAGIVYKIMSALLAFIENKFHSF